MDAAAALRASPLLQGFTETGIGILAGACTPRSYPAGSPLFVESMVSDSMLLIAEGTVRLSTKDAAGHDAALGEVGPGDWLGELSLVTTGQRLCSATAKTGVSAFEIRQADFQKLMATKPQACVKLLMAICAQFANKVVSNRDALKALAKR